MLPHKQASDVIDFLGGATSLQELAKELPDLIQGVIPFEGLIGFKEVDFGASPTARLAGQWLFTRCLEPSSTKSYVDYFYKLDPLLHAMYLECISVGRIEDFISRSDYDHSSFFIDFLSRENLYYELAALLAPDDHHATYRSFVLMRRAMSGKFSSEEVEIFRVLEPHLNEAFYRLSYFKILSDLKQILESGCSKFSVDFILGERSALTRVSQKRVNNSGGKNMRGICEDSLAGYSVEDYPCGHEIKGGSRYHFRFLENSLPCEVFCLPKKHTLTTDRNKARSVWGLSLREIEIADLVAKGYTNRQVGAALFISLHTVKDHLKHIFTKCRVTNRTELISKII